ncbi:hypothetical protein KEM54_003247 [Ascosphaera aggregata]|nr:hypothetical protein KEM54_003247 [Ascosphaera aggregata]
MSYNYVPGTPVRNQDGHADLNDSILHTLTTPQQNNIATEPLFATSATRLETIPTQPLSQPRFTQLTIDDQGTHEAGQAGANGDGFQAPVGVLQAHAHVQVPQSSPRVPPVDGQDSPYQRTPGQFPQVLAPLGTSYQSPRQASGRMGSSGSAQPPQPLIASDDSEGPTYRGSSDNEDRLFLNKTSIKPSTFTQTSRGGRRMIGPGERVPETPPASVAPGGGFTRFKELTANSLYNPNPLKRPGEDTYDASKLLKYARKDGGPAQINDDMDIADIKDFQQRISINRMRQIVPTASVRQCFTALKRARGQWTTAMAILGEIVSGKSSTPPKKPKDDDDDDDDITSLQRVPQKPSQLAAKQQIKSHARIQDRWAASASGAQAPARQVVTRQPPSSAQPRIQPLLPKQQEQEQQEQQEQPSVPTGKPQLRRLVRGQRPGTPMTASTASSRGSSPASSVQLQGPTPAQSKQGGRLIKGKRPTIPASSDNEVLPSDNDAEIQGPPEEGAELNIKVLNFFNNCAAADLADIAEIPENTAAFLISKRPFSSLAQVRQITDDRTKEVPQVTAKKGRTKAKKPIGDKIVDKCLDMWTGYEAVDDLVGKCESLGRPVAEEMKKWGVDIFGDATDNKELEMVTLEEKKGDDENDSDDDISWPSTKPKKRGLIKQPEIMSSDITMKNYQIVGLNWLSLLYHHHLSCILADDMGLGKTAQVIAFLAHLYEIGVRGPHLVVVPSSTLENWLREFSVFCPALNVMPYYAGQKERESIRMQLAEERDKINVVVTTYTIAKAKMDASFLRSMDFCVCVYDEGHMLKNSKSVLYEQLVRIPAEFRLLLTGTPLQNNLQELVSLLGFILPSVFKERKHDLEYIFSAKAKTVDDTHANLLSAQRIARAKSMLTPFVLRRKKHQVIDLPEKINRVEYCEMNDVQKQIYEDEIEEVKRLLLDRAQGKKPTGQKSANNLMRLRQAALHPLFFRKIYDDKTLQRMSKAAVKDDQWAMSDPTQIYLELQAYNDFECHTLCINNPIALSKFQLRKEEWMKSGKVDTLCKLLRQFKANGDRTLIFSQFTMAMDILEHVLETVQMGFYRLDGSTSVEDRQAILDAFYENTDIPVFLLSTKAGGAGINLACANKVVIFDSGFNPQDDVQAENRAHRVGQTRPVEVVRLVTRGTIEEQIYALGKTKLALDQRVSGEDVEGPAAGKKKEEAGLQAVESMLTDKLKERENHEGNDGPKNDI